jgi:hypothetical protein
MSKTNKKVRWLSQKEALLLELTPKENDGNRNQNRYYLSFEEWDFIISERTKPNKRKFVETQKKFDKDGEILSSVEKLQSKPIDVPENFEVIKVSTSKTTGQQWVQYAPKKGNEKKEESIRNLHNDFIKDVKKYSFRYPKFTRSKVKEGHCLVFDAADIHLGKICSSFETGETYNSQIAIQRVRAGLNGIIKKSRGWEIDKVIFIAGNDILHVDNAKSTTTSGTGQDTDQMWYDNFLMAKSLLVEIIETLLTIADVEVVFNPSNHDFTHGFMLLDSVSSWFNKCKQVSFDNDMRHRKYTKYGKNIIGSTHMDGAKVDKLHGLMAEEASEFWHECKHRYIYGHHIHHKTAKDIFSVCIETLRSPSGTDGWHHRNGFQFAPKAVEGFIHHKEHGQVAKLTHIF